MKPESNRKKWIITITALVLAATIGLGLWAVSAKRNQEPVAVFPFHYLGMTEYWGDSQECYGPVRTDKIQTVFLSDTQTVKEILVSTGDTVKKGDPLMTFDTTLTDLALERKRLDVEKLKLQLSDAKAELRRIKNMKPMVIPKPSEDTGDKNLGTALTDPYQISLQQKYDGSTKKLPLICWLNSSTTVSSEVLDALRQTASEYQTENARAEAEAGNAEESTDPTEVPAETTPPEDIQIEANHFYVIFKTTKDNMSLGERTTWQGIYVIRNSTNGTYSFRFFDASSISDHSIPQEDTPEKDEPQIDFGSGYTAAQIAEMRNQQEKTIRDLEFDIKMADANYKIMLTEVSDGKIYAQIDGEVVSVLTEEEAKLTGQPVLKVSGGGGFYAQGSISELEKYTLQIGQEVTINDWNTGMQYTGIVESVGDFPSSGSNWNGMGNPNASFYPFTVFIEGEADLQEGRYVSILYSAGAGENGIYLEKPFLRTEKGQSYVYVRGEDGLLEKRFVTTGKSLWGSYTEILEGLTADDYIAFPYGKNVNPGAQTVESDLSALYG